MSIERVDNLGRFFLSNIEEEYTLRKQQKIATKWFSDKILSNKKFFILEMPTGTGKSLTSQLLINYYLENINKNAKFNLLTCTKNLQEQYLQEFKYIHNLYGKQNYYCRVFDTTCDMGYVLHKKKEKCEYCPHKEALNSWLSGLVSMSNFHTFALYSLYNDYIFENNKRNVLIVDEAHLLEPTTANFVSYTLSKKQWDKFVGIKKSEQWEQKVFRFTKVEEIMTFLEREFLPEMRNTISKYSDNEQKEYVKLVSELESTDNTIKKILSEYNNGNVKWIADKKVVKTEAVWDIQPLWIDTIMKKHIWDNYDHVILMSGTIIDSELFCRVNGIDTNKSAFMKLSSPFKIENRKIFYIPIGKMTFNEKENTWKKYIPYIKKILKKYKGKKGIIHAGNYELLEKIREDIKDDRLLFVTPDNRQEMINNHIRSEKDTVLVSPSLMTGIDLKDDLSRFQLILKMPYPNLGSKLNKTRFEELPLWYTWTTISELVQGYGRSIRSEDDYADTIILDECFSNLISNYNHLIPEYFLNAVKKINI